MSWHRKGDSPLLVSEPKMAEFTDAYMYVSFGLSELKYASDGNMSYPRLLVVQDIVSKAKDSIIVHTEGMMYTFQFKFDFIQTIYHIIDIWFIYTPLANNSEVGEFVDLTQYVLFLGIFITSVSMIWLIIDGTADFHATWRG